MSPHPRVTNTAVLLAVVTAGVVFLWPTLQSLSRQWSDTESMTLTHGYLIAAISAFLLLRTARASDSQPAPDWRVAIPLAILSIAWLIAYRAGIEIAHQLLLPVLLFLAVCTALGVRNGMRYGFPFAYLYFAMSIWGAGNDILKGISVRAVKLMLQISAVPAYVDGNVVTIPEGVFEVEGGCSGLHYFIVALAVAALFGELHRDHWKVRARQILLAAVLAMASNWIRIYVVVVAGHVTDMQHYLVRVEHLSFGWGVFAAAMGLFFWLVSRDPARPVPTPQASVGGSLPGNGRLLAGAAISVLAVGAGPMLRLAAPERPAAATEPLLPGVAGWEGPGVAQGTWSPQFPQADRRALATYVNPGSQVSAFVAEYDVQHQHKELVGYGNSLFDGLDANIETSAKVETPRGTIRVLFMVDAEGGKSLFTYYYEIGAQRVASGLPAQLRYAFASLSGPVSSRVIAAHMPCVPDCEAASASVQRLFDAIDSARTTHP